MDYFGLSLSLSTLPPSSQIHRMQGLIPQKPRLYHAPILKTYASDLLSAFRHHPALHAYLLTNRCSANLVLTITDLWAKLKLSTYSLPLPSSSTPTTSLPPHRLVSSASSSTLSRQTDDQASSFMVEGELRPEDVREVLLSCVGHRLRMREESERLSSFWNPSKGASKGLEVEEVVQEVLKTV